MPGRAGPRRGGRRLRVRTLNRARRGTRNARPREDTVSTSAPDQPQGDRVKRSDSPRRTPDFRALLTSFALSQLATNISYVAVPLAAVEALGAGPGQVGALASLSSVAFLLIGLPAGAWVDRLDHRRILIAADLCRALLFATLPLAWWLDTLTLGHLYAIVLLNGCATVFFDVGSQSVLPSIVGRDGLIRANTDINTLLALGNMAGRSAGGALVALLTAPVTLVVTAGAYLASGLRLTSIRRTARETPPGRTGAVSLRAQIGEGVRHVFGSGHLRALALSATLVNLGSAMVTAMLPIVFVRELGLSSAAFGLFGAVGGVAVLCGARSARPLAGRFGYGRTLAVGGLYLAPAGLLVPLIDRGPWLLLAGAGWFTYIFKMGMDNVLGVTLRQRMTPDALLGRMIATFRFLLTGALAVGAGLSGLLGELAGVQTALWVGGALVSTSFLPVLLSPVRTLRELPDQQPQGEKV
nr:MFS transporter [Streptomyces sp. CBMA156]